MIKTSRKKQAHLTSDAPLEEMELKTLFRRESSAESSFSRIK
jgi:hypothetical protein